MTNRTINKAIAEFLGWKELDFHLDGKRILGDRPTFSNGKIISYTVDQYAPDYCNDLNEMHEAEKMLNEKQEDIMNSTLWDIMDGRKYLWHSTAAQRAKAFVITIGKHEE
jgi:hypothetical protein